MRKLFLGIIAVLVIFYSIGRLSSNVNDSAIPEPAVVATAQKTKPIRGEERKRIVSTLTKSLVEERDKIEKISFYSANKTVYTRSGIDAYISLPDNRLPLLRMRPIYFGDNWIFYKTVKIMVDDSVIYERAFQRSDIVRDNAAGSVWETADFIAREKEVSVLKAIATSKSATIRFSGSERRHDHEVTAKERPDIKKILDAYEKLSSSLIGRVEV